MNEIQIFNNPQFGEIRTSKTELGEPVFCASDVTSILGYKNGRKAIADNCNSKGVTTGDTLTKGGVQILTYINESNLYRLVMRSKLPDAEKFQDWVCEEVLPSIRKNGGFITTKTDDTPELIMARALLVADATIKNQLSQLQEQAPKVLFADAVTTSDKSILIGELAKIICQNGYEIGQNRLFVFLRKSGYLGTHGEYYNIPTQRAIEMGLFEIKKTTITKPDGTVLVSTTSKVTGKGQIYFVNKFIGHRVTTIEA